jgi:hypothetical protein
MRSCSLLVFATRAALRESEQQRTRQEKLGQA